jgi:hypothetical protein
MATRTQDVFSNVTKQDYFGFFPSSRPRFEEVVRKLDFQKEDVAGATEVPLGSIRYDGRIPRELANRIREWGNLLNLVAEHFDGDPNKTVLWFTVRNPVLGNVAPRDMIRLGRYDKLLRFVSNARIEGRR